MERRFAAIWFPHLQTDWFANRQPELKDKPFVIVVPVHGKMIVKGVNAIAVARGVVPGWSLADARAFIPEVEVVDDKPELAEKLLKKLAEWCIRFTPVSAVDLNDGIVLDISGCAHLWGGEEAYAKDNKARLQKLGYKVRIGIADTIGAAWAMARYGVNDLIVPPCKQLDALLPLPPAALRLDTAIVERLQKLGLYTISTFVHMQRSALRRRFGTSIIKRIDQALGNEEEFLEPVQLLTPYNERLSCLEPIVTRNGIEIAIKQLLNSVCIRLQKEGKGLRYATLKFYRVDGDVQELSIGTHSASNNADHLFRLFELNIDTIRPGLGIELFTIEAGNVQEAKVPQAALWKNTGNIESIEVAELLDRVKGKMPGIGIHRFLPAEHYWPERSFRETAALEEKPSIEWRTDKPRPIHLLQKPQLIKVTAPIPDYPPMLFTYQGVIHKVVAADGPERIEREWWLDGGGLHRDYYCVEDAEGKRYWLFRLGHYNGEQLPKWFIHGFFA
jgi:protein ImuB